MGSESSNFDLPDAATVQRPTPTRWAFFQMSFFFFSRSLLAF